MAQKTTLPCVTKNFTYREHTASGRQTTLELRPRHIYIPPSNLETTCAIEKHPLTTMNFFPLTLAVFTAITAACIAPFNDRDFFNHTVLSEYVDAQLAKAPATGGPGWFTVIAPAAPHVQ